MFARKARRIRNARAARQLALWRRGARRDEGAAVGRAALRREVAVLPFPDPPPCPRPSRGDLGPILDEELAALPECYREAIVLCDLRGLSREEAAALLGMPEGTLSSRLANGRKKLAARLTKRGVSLSVAGLVGTIGQAWGGAVVSNELVSRTCALVADWSAGGAVPGPLARLAEGGFFVRKTLLVGVLMLISAAGAVVAAGLGDNSKPAEPPKPVAVAKSEPALQPKAGEKLAFTTKPKLRIARDYRVGNIQSVTWSPDGGILAFQGSVRTVLQGGSKGNGPSIREEDYVQLDGGVLSPNAIRPRIPVLAESEFVGFTPDGKNS